MKVEAFGYTNIEEYLDDFLASLLPSNMTKDYFVDWAKVKAQIKPHINEISLLNSLIHINPKDRKEHLRDMIREYPKVREVLPLLLVVKNKVSLLAVESWKDLSFISVDFKRSKPEDIAEFCEKVGLLDLFGEIKEVYDYLFGVGVGRDTNARKNRSGETFENLFELYLKANNVKYVRQDPNFEFQDPEKKRKKRPDFTIQDSKGNLFVVEANFYNTTGSKPLEVASSYIQLNKYINERGARFIWVTDGPAWRGMSQGLKDAIYNIDYVFNYRLATKYLPNLLSSSF